MVSLEDQFASTVMLVGTLQQEPAVVNCAWLVNGAVLNLESVPTVMLENEAAEVLIHVMVALWALSRLLDHQAVQSALEDLSRTLTLLLAWAVMQETTRLLDKRLVQSAMLVLIHQMELAVAVCVLEAPSVPRVQENVRRVPGARLVELELVLVDHVRQESTAQQTSSSALLATLESLAEKVRRLVLRHAQLERTLEQVLRTVRTVSQGRSQQPVHRFAVSASLVNGVMQGAVVVNSVVLENTVLLLLPSAWTATLRRERSPVLRVKARVGLASQGKEPMMS
jgi:hypothetical protein